MGDEFIRQFEEFDYSEKNPMHKSSAQVRDGAVTPMTRIVSF